jgi:hypothetical protein
LLFAVDNLVRRTVAACRVVVIIHAAHPSPRHSVSIYNFTKSAHHLQLYFPFTHSDYFPIIASDPDACIKPERSHYPVPAYSSRVLIHVLYKAENKKIAWRSSPSFSLALRELPRKCLFEEMIRPCSPQWWLPQSTSHCETFGLRYANSSS